ncbi:G-type lectin S-receptor-like serine/threonine-protein kinase SD2-5 [Oryza brachyantha]|uniref:G-type lectin S-receptor-like serine/threonine-protein kinase SD2-5 n=1 Tax=Oryza brachyantha TaxID=4533 RepID=UPI0007769459|nr:G-type lectin S-receptor-like serine/threonine-protein kinase SD2-5 [Oryza brachyantha]XP_040376005.1 G-type lectin S-receptor-like serine/threonine-protein kinase SD2-5 [Oryza brachyantha]XP_040376006.1 G-type lectin S-receptor-like serine/threonine-protein kinase SD2-5 [Oryza brachyantha]
MKQFNSLVAILCMFAFHVVPTAVAQLPSAAPANIWRMSDLPTLHLRGNSSILLVLSNINASYRTDFGFYTSDGHSFVLSVFYLQLETVIWSANPDNPVNYSAVLNFTRDGDLLLSHSNGSVIWSTATKGKQVATLSLEALGNLVLSDKTNTYVWQSFDHPTDTLVLGQSLCFGMRLTAIPSAKKWESARIYLSADLGGLRYSFEPAAYSKLFQPTVVGNSTSICYSFVNGSLGFPNQIIALPPTRSLQLMRLESDGHLRLYEILVPYPNSMQLVFDVLSTVMDYCDYPLACGDYGVCSNGQCSCPSLSYFRFKNERHPEDGCIPLTSISCNRQGDHQLQPLNDVSYPRGTVFQSLATASQSENICKLACLRDCSCRVALFQRDGYNDSGSCLLLSEKKLMLLVEGSPDHSSAFIKIQGDRSKNTKITAVVSSVVAFLSLVLIIIPAVIWRTKKKADEESFIFIPGAPKRFSYDELKVATRKFSAKLGAGGFGSVFKGKIGKEIIAVKCLEGVEQGMEEFLAEVKTIGRIHHLNLVSLIGFCSEKSHRLLVYEYMSNGSLDKWIFHTSPVFTLSWKTRRNIIMAIARGLSYLHEECKEKIAHLDIKPQNILLDDKFNAKLSDFGLSKQINRDQSKIMTRMRGTRGYLAPEWLGSRITEKADTYSFGIVMTEIICGRKNLDESQPEESIHLVSLLQEKARSGQLFDLVDNGSDDMQCHIEEVMEMMNLAMWCLQVDSTRRPLMSTVAKVLEGAMNMEDMPDYSFVPDYVSNHTNIAGSNSCYKPTESHLSGPR